MINRLSTQSIEYSSRITTVDKNSSMANSLKTQERSDLVVDEDTQAVTRTEKDDKEKVSNLEEVVKKINDFLEPTHTSVKFVYHDKLDEYYVNIIDDQTNEVVREIPSKKLLDTYASMLELAGLLVDKKV